MIEGISILDHLRTCQNQVFKAVRQGELCILRLTDPAHRTQKQLRSELALLTDLRDVATVVQPLPFLSGEFIQVITYEGKPHNGMLFSFVNGSPAFVLSTVAGARFGAFLATLHTELAKLTTLYDLPARVPSDGDRQLIHGDFNPTNVLVTADTFVVIDFESACYASHEYELANTIYMVMFDLRHDVAKLVDSHFVEGFLTGYTSRRSADLRRLRNSIDHRIDMLLEWLNDLTTAPLSIAASPESWRLELRDFVDAFKDGRFDAVIASII